MTLLPNTATPTRPQGDAGVCDNNADAESLQCQDDADQELHMNKRKGSPIDTHGMLEDAESLQIW